MDFKLTVGIDTDPSFAQMSSDIESIVQRINSKPPQIQVGLVLTQDAEKNIRSQIANILNQNNQNSSNLAMGNGDMSSIAANIRAANNSAAAHKNDASAKQSSANASRRAASAAREEASATQAATSATNRRSSATVSDTAVMSKYSRSIKTVEGALGKWTKAEHSSNGESRKAYAAIQNQYNATQAKFQQYIADSASAEELNDSINQLNESYKVNGEVIRQNGDATKTWGDRLGGLAKKFSQWFGVSQIIMQVYRTLKKMVSISVELDSAFAQLKIVTGATDAEMEKFKETSIELSKSVGQSVTDVTKSIETFSRLGYNLQQSAELAKYSSILSNTAAVSSEEATTGLTSIIKGFNLDVSQSEHISDVLVEVGQKYAVSAGEMMEAYERSSAALNATNTSFEKSAGLIAAANASVQDSSVVGKLVPSITVM